MKMKYFDANLISIGDGVMEKLVSDYGSKKLVFGSGFPDGVPESAILQLRHADIPDKDRAAIGSENLEKLILEVDI